MHPIKMTVIIIHSSIRPGHYYITLLAIVTVMGDNYVAFKAVDVSDYRSSMCVSLFMSMQEGSPGGGQVSTD